MSNTSLSAVCPNTSCGTWSPNICCARRCRSTSTPWRPSNLTNPWRTALITFSAGLVIRIGDRSLQFERDLGSSGQLQFKYLDNYEIVTLGWGRLYAQILNREIHVVHQNGHKVHLAGGVDG